ncbi:LPS export ABC transporter periplasmic protein LptC [Polaribacter litorisediminis]|uniref:LPS export ABC transporter periplasmic protein LptC n=1 Tax=Polaribacter litorisediminis TaxID=1908341 RepID=UPI001CBC2F9E|nr:LPS export ABC transporter periplasmic protein LptC [Polaribacter litorisediminis]UAM98756.1 LPS export ABC transporter periplasmic protein LptC [Polaribacter litorisediminis]
MNITTNKIIKSIALLLGIAMLFSCDNNTQKARDFLADKNLPIGITTNAFHVYKDSGRITSKLITAKMLDYSNRTLHPYSKFPEGIKIVNFENKGLDSITITGDFALSYTKTSISEIKGNVVVINHSDKSRLETEQLFWDEKTKYFVSEKAFKLTKENDTIFGIGFESKDDLSKHLSKKTIGKLETSEN